MVRLFYWLLSLTFRSFKIGSNNSRSGVIPFVYLESANTEPIFKDLCADVTLLKFVNYFIEEKLYELF